MINRYLYDKIAAAAMDDEAVVLDSLPVDKTAFSAADTAADL